MSLRTKQALILLIATVLPFAMGAAAVSLVVAPAYRREVSRGSVQMTRRLAEHVAWSLARDMARLERLAAWPVLREGVIRASAEPEDSARTERLARTWTHLTARDGRVERLLDNPIGRELRWWQQTDASASEILVTDARGRLVAASGKPSDYLQADEAWWQYAWAGGQGKVYVSDVLYDASSKTWALAVAVPVYRGGSPGTPAVGVLKAVLDLGRGFQQLSGADAGSHGETLLVDRLGRIALGPPASRPLSETLARRVFSRLRENPNASVVLDSEDGAYLYAWARVPLAAQVEHPDVRVPTLYAVSRRNTEEAFAPLRTVHGWMLAISAATILAAVALGYWLAESLVVRPVRRLADGMRELASGDFPAAAAIAEEITAGKARAR